jgi:predicted peroxiredoxin
MTSLVLQLWQTSAAAPQLAASPFMLAASAAAMDWPVEIHALGASVELFVRDNAARHQVVAPLNRPLAAYIEDATRSGVRVYLCSTAMRDRGLVPEDMLEECQSVLGMVTMLERLAQVDTTVLTY